MTDEETLDEWIDDKIRKHGEGLIEKDNEIPRDENFFQAIVERELSDNKDSLSVVEDNEGITVELFAKEIDQVEASRQEKEDAEMLDKIKEYREMDMPIVFDSVRKEFGVNKEEMEVMKDRTKALKKLYPKPEEDVE